MNLGDTIGKYEIRKKLGAGGMGEVYLAYDTQLQRDIALKILPAEFTQDEIRLHRFKQEARTISALNHPNIITIYEIGEAEDFWFIATEFVDGVTLRQYLQDSPLTIRKAVRIAEQIAQALVAAHEAGIVHRDIKPENIMIRSDGYVKVLDFGLAKPTKLVNESDLENTTVKIVKTTPGMVMGSVRYMSPEQTRGQKVDGRTDIWSLGILLYEMISGWTPFEGATTSDTLAAVIHLEPVPLTQFSPNPPPELQNIVQKALQKNVADRYQKSKEIQIDLKKLLYQIEHEISSENKIQASFETQSSSENPKLIHQTLSANHPTQMSGEQVSSAESIVQKIGQKKWRVLTAVFSLIFIAFIFFGYRFWFGKKSNLSATAFEKIKVSRLESDGKVRLSAISPDGKYLAYASGELGNRSLVVRQISTNSLVTIVPPTVLDFSSVKFSPNGDYVYYSQISKNNSINTLYQVPTLGGTPKKLIEDVDSPVTFSPDGKQIAFRRHVSSDNTDLIFTANSDGSNLQEIISTKETDFSIFLSPYWFPKEAKLLITTGTTQGGIVVGYGLAEISISEKNIKPVGSKKWLMTDSICWLKDGTGFLLAGQEIGGTFSQLWRVSYPSGDAKAITNDSNNYFDLGYSEETNTIVSIRRDNTQGLWSFSPKSKTINQLMPERRNLFWDTRISQLPNGEIVFSRGENNILNFFQSNPDGTNERLLLSETKASSNPVVSPDGKYIVFSSMKSGKSRIWRVNTDGSNLTQLTETNDDSADYSPKFSIDGKNIIFERANSNWDKSILVKMDIEGNNADNFFDFPQTFVMNVEFSPDGNFVAFIIFNPKTAERIMRISSLERNVIKQTVKKVEYNLIEKFQWSPNSKSITYLSRDGVSNLWELPLDDNKPKPISEFKTGRIFNFTWSKDGENIFIIRGIINNDLVLIKNEESVQLGS